MARKTEEIIEDILNLAAVPSILLEDKLQAIADEVGTLYDAGYSDALERLDNGYNAGYKQGFRDAQKKSSDDLLQINQIIESWSDVDQQLAELKVETYTKLKKIIAANIRVKGA